MLVQLLSREFEKKKCFHINLLDRYQFFLLFEYFPECHHYLKIDAFLRSSTVLFSIYTSKQFRLTNFCILDLF